MLRLLSTLQRIILPIRLYPLLDFTKGIRGTIVYWQFENYQIRHIYGRIHQLAIEHQAQQRVYSRDTFVML